TGWLLTMPRRAIETATLYSPDQQGGFAEEAYKAKTDLAKTNFLPKDIVFTLDTINAETNTFYLKVETNEAFQFPLTVWNPAAYSNSIKNSMILTGMFIGISLLVCLFYLFQFYR